MPAPRPFPKGTVEKLRLELRRARTKGQHQKVLCVWMRAVLHLKADTIAQALDMSGQSVRQTHMEYMRQGEAIFRRPGKGGRRRQNLPVKAEREFLERLLNQTGPANALLDARFIHQSYEKAVGHAVSSSAVYRMLRRHNWRKLSEGAIFTPARRPAAAGLAPEDEEGVAYGE